MTTILEIAAGFIIACGVFFVGLITGAVLGAGGERAKWESAIRAHAKDAEQRTVSGVVPYSPHATRSLN